MKKILAIVLSICMALPLAAFAGEGSTNFNYVALGASDVNGYGMHGYLDEELYGHPELIDKTSSKFSAYRRIPKGCYPDLVRDALEEKGYTVNLSQLAQSSMRVAELRFLLDENYAGDAYTKWRFYSSEGKGWFENLEALRKDYKESIQNADLITYGFGANDFGTYVVNQLMADKYTNDVSTLVKNKKQLNKYNKYKKQVIKILKLALGDDYSDMAGEVTEKLIDTFSYALFEYCSNFDATIKIIRKLNPDAELIVTSTQNILKGVELTYDGTKIPLGNIMKALLNVANLYTASVSPYSDKYHYADLRKSQRCNFFIDELLEYNGDPTSLSVNMKDCYDTYDSDLFIKQRVTAQLQQKGITEGTPEYELALNTAYDTITRILMAAAKIENPSIENIDTLISNKDNIANELMADIQNTVASAVNTALETGETNAHVAGVEDAISAMLQKENVKALAMIGVRISMGNTFFAHPSAKGYEEIANKIMEVYENETTGQEATVKAIFGEKASNSILSGALNRVVNKTAKASRLVISGMNFHKPVFHINRR